MIGLALQQLILGLCVFIPTFIVARAMRFRGSRAFVLAGVFSIGAVLGAQIAQLMAALALGHSQPAEVRELLNVTFIIAGAAAGGAITLWLTHKAAKVSPWRRD